MHIYKTRQFAKWALKDGLTDGELRMAVAEMEAGLRIPPMSATHSTPCRPGIPPHAGHLFRRMSARV
jgi:hypothetical protein